ncbi:hypothetical protein CHLNCDRAFT_56832 [Chlorella variabilis]|uniref:Nucleoporin Nup54 alpha-helical domain-containing protein n=1 Tax=Chlorella variabilis TaxID=554065 RepID=E1Z6R8_CHLVA|nr:hypothetical protein CHLNCDRAFT_56832 [Chlorella variabilis]EFN58397.1 hypothetical protein CHLNCDRAFT_56832 [Chlorella variabilis]|eukprot:XP_005850499.1 hypothetical protein CHLNCDRAFT_56832 [Chlorella variabilis]
MFSFGAASTPAFGAASSAAAPAFGQAAPAFGAAPSPFGGGVATPAFGASSASLFGATPAPSLFGGGPTSAFGFQSSAAGASPSLFGAAAPTVGAPSQQVTALTTKDNRPITHSSKWDDLSPQTQQYLTELEKVVVQYREDCRQLDNDPRLASGSGAKEQQEAMQAQARSLSQAISALGSAVKADVEQVGALREAVLYLVRSTDTALHTFKRAHAWREASKASAPLASQDIAGPPVLPAQFLREAVAMFLDRLKQHQAAVAELEQVLLASGATGQMLRRASGGNGSHPADGLAALQAALTNVHDFLIHTAARLQALDDRVAAAREAFLARRRAAGDSSDPFAEEERRQHKRSAHQPRSPAAQAAALQAAQQPHAAQQPPGTGYTTTTFGMSPAPASHAASPGGLFGTLQPSPGGAFGTPLNFGDAQQQRSAPTSRKPSSRRR